MILTPLAEFIIQGLIAKDYLFRRARAVFFSMPLKSWLYFLAGVAGLIATLIILNWSLYWLLFGLGAGVLAVLFHVLVRSPLRAEQKGALDHMHRLLRDLRLRGVPEETLHDFICRFTDLHWEEFFERLFGYELMILTRGKWASLEKVNPRKKFATWRDPIARWLDDVEQTRKQAREQKQLAKAEVKRLKAKGMEEKAAEKVAEEEAKRIIKEELVQPPPEAKTFDWQTLPATKGSFSLLKGGGKVIYMLCFRIPCMLVGIAIVAAYAAELLANFNVTLPGSIDRALKTYYQWGWGQYIHGLAAGAALIIAAFFGRFIPTIMVLTGTAIIVTHIELLALIKQPQLTSAKATLAAIVLILTGLAFSSLRQRQKTNR